MIPSNNDFEEQIKRDFEDSVFCEELDADSIPAELMAEFENSTFSQPADMLDITLDDIIIRD